MPAIALIILSVVFLVPKSALKSAAYDLYTVFMVSVVIYALSFMCQPCERYAMRLLMIVMIADCLMKIVFYIIGA